MVRKCETMTLACAIVCIAGSVAGGAEKLTISNAKSTLVKNTPAAATPLTYRQMVGAAEGASLFGTGAPRCLCEGWDNGTWDGESGQTSHLGGAVPFGEKAADDFFLCEGQIHDVTSVSGFLITNSNPFARKAKAELFADCNGSPSGDPLYTFTEFTFGTITPLADGFFLVEYIFTMANQVEEDEQNIVLRGGAYWLAIMGKTDGQCPNMPNMCDISFFATTGDGIVKGAVAHKTYGVNTGVFNQFSFPGPWISVEDCCIDCTDLAFTVCATPCKILLTNGEPDRSSTPRGAISERSTITSRDRRCADDFVVNPCEDFVVCYIEACIYTNCPDPRVCFEIYENDCNLPSYFFGDSVPAGRSGCATKLTPTGIDYTLPNGDVLVGYKAEFHDLSILLPRGRTYWLSIFGLDTSSFREVTYWCFATDCRRPNCNIRFNPGACLDHSVISSHPPVPTGWVSVNRDFVFCIAGNYVTDTTPGDGGAGTACIADANNSGTVEPADIFIFLDAWFRGCP